MNLLRVSARSVQAIIGKFELGPANDRRVAYLDDASFFALFRPVADARAIIAE